MKSHLLIPVILGTITLILLWQLISLSLGFPMLFPPVDKLSTEVIGVILQPKFIPNLTATLLRGLSGFTIACIGAFLLASLAYTHIFWQFFLQPTLVLTRSTPVISLVLIALLWFPPTTLPIFIALITMFPIMYQHILTGLQCTDNQLLEMGLVFGKSPLQRYIHICLPAARPHIIAGTKTALGFGWRAIIIGEVLSQPFRGIGTAMKQAQVYLNIPELIAWTIVAIIISYIFEGLISFSTNLDFHYRGSIGGSKASQTTLTPRDAPDITLSLISKSFDTHEILKNFNYRFEAHKIYFVKGPSGIGKTTLLNLIAGLVKADSGIIDFNIPARRGYSFQDFRLLPHLNAIENIRFGLQSKQLHKNEIVDHLLLKSQLITESHKLPSQLSGGQQQRVSISRALAAQPNLLLLDEPLNGLDLNTKESVLLMIKDYILTQKPTVIWATHEDISLNTDLESELIMDRKRQKEDA